MEPLLFSSNSLIVGIEEKFEEVCVNNADFAPCSTATLETEITN